MGTRVVGSFSAEQTHLLDLGSHDGIPILPPAEFLERVDTPSD